MSLGGPFSAEYVCSRHFGFTAGSFLTVLVSNCAGMSRIDTLYRQQVGPARFLNKIRNERPVVYTMGKYQSKENMGNGLEKPGKGLGKGATKHKGK